MRSASGLSWEACGHSTNWLTLFQEEIFAENTFLLQLFLTDLTDHITAQTHPLAGRVFRQHKVTCAKDDTWLRATMARRVPCQIPQCRMEDFPWNLSRRLHCLSLLPLMNALHSQGFLQPPLLSNEICFGLFLPFLKLILCLISRDTVPSNNQPTNQTKNHQRTLSGGICI